LKQRLNAAKQRCVNPHNERYSSYGARGICFNFPSVLQAGLWIIQNLGDCPPKMTLDRKDNNGHYEPGNLRWATVRQQTLNTRWSLQWTCNGKHIPKEHALHVIRFLCPLTDYADQTIRRFMQELKTVEAVLDRIYAAPQSCKPRGRYGTFSTPDREIVSRYLGI
jgi:hypothetical protein